MIGFYHKYRIAYETDYGGSQFYEMISDQPFVTAMFDLWPILGMSIISVHQGEEQLPEDHYRLVDGCKVLIKSKQNAMK